MKNLLPLLLLSLAAPGCKSTMERAPNTWYPVAEVVCYDPGCPRCRGTSGQACPPCRATGKVKCTRCTDGIVKCDTCKGDGRHNSKTCKVCDGKGKRKCPTCDGTLKMDCGHCEGKARISCFRVLVVSEPPPAGDDAWPPGNEPGHVK